MPPGLRTSLENVMDAAKSGSVEKHEEEGTMPEGKPKDESQTQTQTAAPAVAPVVDTDAIAQAVTANLKETLTTDITAAVLT